MNANQIEENLNLLIETASKNGGHVYIVDKKQNSFALKLTTAVRVVCYEGFKKEVDDE